MREILIIGGGVAGLTAAISAHQVDSQANITVLQEEKVPAYRRSALPHIVDGTAKLEEVIMFPEAKFSGVKLLMGWKAYDIDVNSKKVMAKDEHGKEQPFTYDSLILATGAKASFPQIKGIESDKVLALRSYQDAQKIAQAQDVVTIVGAGPIALMIAQALQRRGLKVNLVVRSRVLRAYVEPQISKAMTKRLRDSEINVLQGSSVLEVKESGDKAVLVTSSGELPSSLIIFASGTEANLDLAKKAGLTIGENAIVTNNEMRTSIPDIFATGDCAEVEEEVSRKLTYIPLASIAAKTGAVAGINAAGGKAKAEGLIRIQNEELFGANLLSMGYTLEQAKEKLDPQAQCWEIKWDGAPAFVVGTSEGKVIGISALLKSLSSFQIELLYDAIKHGETLSELRRKWCQPYEKMMQVVLEGR